MSESSSNGQALPTREDCLAIVRAGKPWPNVLHWFVYSFEPVESFEREMFRSRLIAVLDEARRTPETPGKCPIDISYHDVCSAGTCTTCTDAARYRVLRVSSLARPLQVVDENVQPINDDEIDRAIDAYMAKALTPKSEGNPT